MRPTSKLAKELAGQRGPYSIKVKAIQKTNVHRVLENSELNYQFVMFQDEEGAKLQSIIYNDSLTEFVNTIEEEMEYEITNARVEMMGNVNMENPEDQLYRLRINSDTIVDRIPLKPKYVLIASIPRKSLLGDSYDVLGIVIYVDPNWPITRPNGQVRNICEVVIVDQSSEQIMIVAAWEDKVIEECRRLQSTAASFPVIGFTALRSANRKGFSLALTPKTAIILDPHGGEADLLRAWRRTNEGLLRDKSFQVFQVRQPQGQCNIVTMEYLLQKKAKNTLQEEQHWLAVQLTESSTPNLRFYSGCSKCGTRNYEHLGDTYACRECMTEDVISSPRLCLTFEAGDETGNYIFDALTENAETLLEVTAADLHSMLPQEKEDYLGQIARHLRSATFYIQVEPSRALSIKQELVWVLKQVALT